MGCARSLAAVHRSPAPSVASGGVVSRADPTGVASGRFFDGGNDGLGGEDWVGGAVAGAAFSVTVGRPSGRADRWG